jgi:hypothetical protein|tara:strand:- start:149 stop:265 length:117 start_codon:yes stop_codon:yes gene_type:complete
MKNKVTTLEHDVVGDIIGLQVLSGIITSLIGLVWLLGV